MTVPVITLRLPKLYRKQYDAIFDPHRYSIIDASTKAGKTAGALIWLLSQASTATGDSHNFWWVAPIFPQAKIAYRRMRRMLIRADPTKTIWESNETELFIRMKTNGAMMWFKGSDDPDSLYGEDVYGCVCDEASRIKEEAWYAIRSTLTFTKGHLRVIGNVKGRANWAYKMGQKAKAGDPEMAYHKLTAYDAVEGGVLDAQEIEDAKRVLPEQVFRELYLAEPSDDGGNPFGIASIKKCVMPLSTKKPAVFGSDLAKSHDWTWLIGLDDAGIVCLSERWQSDWKATEDRLCRIIGGTPALIDSTGVGDPIVENLQRRCRKVEGYKFTIQSKQQIMEGLASAIQQQAIGFPAGTLQDELDSYEYEYTRTGVKYTAPEGLFDDGVCALALAWHQLSTGLKLRPITDWGAVASSNAMPSLSFNS